MTREEMMQMMEEAGINGRSKLNMRSEAIQHKFSARRYAKLKKAPKKKSKLLLVAEMAVPFNPMTGKADDQFNAVDKYRPPFSATSVALMLKDIANENQATKEEFMNRAGISEWDTSDSTVLTEADKQVFSKYRVPRVFSIPVCRINIPKITGGNFPREYAVDVKRDNTGNVVGEMPGFLKVNKLFRDICYEKCEDLERRIENGEETLTDQQKADRKKEFRGEIAVSDDAPSNWVQFIEIPMTSGYELSSEAFPDTPTADAVDSMLVVHKYTKDIEEFAMQYVRGELKLLDKNFDFFEMDMVCPSDGDENTSTGKMLIGKNTKFEKPVIKLNDNEKYPVICDAVRKCLDTCTDVEEIVRRSIYVSVYNEEIENQIYTSLKTVLDITNNPFVTKKVIAANAEVIALAYGDEGMQLVEEVEADVSDKAEGGLDVAGSNAIGEQAKFDLSSEEFTDAADGDNNALELETFTMS